MKKRALSIGIITMLGAVSAQADTILGLYAGAQGWNMATSGGFSDDGTNLQFDFEDKTQASFYVAFEHPIPLVPNIKVQRGAMDTSGKVFLESNFTFGDELFIANSSVVTDVKLSSTDAILYYELFDNDLISFDVGVNAKYLDGELFVIDSEDPTTIGREEFSGVVPMVYSRIAIGVPTTGLGIYVEGSFLSFDDQTLTDYQAAITYSLLENLAIDLTFQLGYRSVELDLDDLDGIYSNLEFKGVFAGIEVHF